MYDILYTIYTLRCQPYIRHIELQVSLKNQGYLLMENVANLKKEIEDIGGPTEH